MSTTPPPNYKALWWVVLAVMIPIGCVSAINNDKATDQKNRGVNSDYCREAGKEEFTSFNDPAWKDYVKRCAPPGVK